MILVKFFLFFCLFTIVAVVWTVFRVYWKFRSLSSSFKQQQDNRADTAYQQRQQSDGNIVIDRRSKEAKNRKIFDDNEGEYVDYTEEP